MLTAYARECERAGVRITRWRESTGCRNVKPFKYSGEHSGETSATSDTNATLNEVITHDGGASEPASRGKTNRNQGGYMKTTLKRSKQNSGHW